MVDTICPPAVALCIPRIPADPYLALDLQASTIDDDRFREIYAAKFQAVEGSFAGDPRGYFKSRGFSDPEIAKLEKRAGITRSQIGGAGALPGLGYPGTPGSYPSMYGANDLKHLYSNSIDVFRMTYAGAQAAQQSQPGAVAPRDYFRSVGFTDVEVDALEKKAGITHHKYLNMNDRVGASGVVPTDSRAKPTGPWVSLGKAGEIEVSVTGLPDKHGKAHPEAKVIKDKDLVLELEKRRCGSVDERRGWVEFIDANKDRIVFDATTRTYRVPVQVIGEYAKVPTASVNDSRFPDGLGMGMTAFIGTQASGGKHGPQGMLDKPAAPAPGPEKSKEEPGWRGWMKRNSYFYRRATEGK